MKVEQDERFRQQRERFRLKWNCEDCLLFDPELERDVRGAELEVSGSRELGEAEQERGRVGSAAAAGEHAYAVGKGPGIAQGARERGQGRSMAVAGGAHGAMVTGRRFETKMVAGGGLEPPTP